MIEVTTKTMEGVRFIADVKVLEPDSTYLGIPIHRIDTNHTDAEILKFLKAIGFRNAGQSEDYLADMYTQGRIFYWRLITIRALFKCYWAVIKWSYNNGRIFKQIPSGSCFSWSYFTPYCWYLKAKARF